MMGAASADPEEAAEGLCHVNTYQKLHRVPLERPQANILLGFSQPWLSFNDQKLFLSSYKFLGFSRTKS